MASGHPQLETETGCVSLLRLAVGGALRPATSRITGKVVPVPPVIVRPRPGSRGVGRESPRNRKDDHDTADHQSNGLGSIMQYEPSDCNWA